METLLAMQDDSSGANPSSIKSDDSSPRQNNGRGSPPPKCAICLGTCKNKSFTDSCLHQFCFKCLLQWSKVKAVCPLCKQNFRSIIHNVRSNDQYEEYMVEQRQTEESTERLDIDALTMPARHRFRYRTTLTLPRRETIAIQQWLLQYPLVAEAFPRAPPRRRRSPASFRRTVYRHNLWARPLPDFTGRFRDCSPDFYRYNETQMHRLVPWLNRELHYLLNENVGHISYVLNRILELLRQYHISSPEFSEVMRRYFGDRTEHFLHELYCFASTPYDMTGYDRNVQYTTDTRISTMVNEVISSSDSEASVDSDIVMVSSSEPAEAPPGPSRPPPSVPPTPSYPHHYIPPPAQACQPAPNVIPIETISHSDSDDDSSEVMVVGYIKPPQERTPEVVDLLGSDSDVVVQEVAPPAPEPELERPPRLPVKLSLKMLRPRNSDSEDEYRPPPPAKRRRVARSDDVATTSDTCRTTPSPAPRWNDTASNSTRWSSSMSTSSESSDMDFSSGDGSSSSSDSYAKRSKIFKKKLKKKSSKETLAPSRDRRKHKKRKPLGNRKSKKSTKENQVEKDKRSKHKSHSGKGVKSSKKPSEPTEASTCAPVQSNEEPQAGPSGMSGVASSHKHKSSRERKRRRRSRDNRRLKSVVNIMYNNQNVGETNAQVSSSVNCNISSNQPSSEPIYSDDRSRQVQSYFPELESQLHGDPTPVKWSAPASSDSEDDLPLNLTIQTSSHTYTSL